MAKLTNDWLTKRAGYDKIHSLDDLYGRISRAYSRNGTMYDKKLTGYGDYAVYHTIAMMYKPINVIECGTNEGLSAMAWALALEHLHLHGEDDGFVHTWDIKEKVKIDIGTTLEHRIIRYIHPFHEGVTKVIDNIRGPRLYFIDGEHTFKAVQKDWQTIKPFVKEGEIVVFHDVNKLDIENLVTRIPSKNTLILPKRIGVLEF